MGVNAASKPFKVLPFVAAIWAWVFLCSGAELQSPAKSWIQRDADAYTRYELLDPGSNSFRILYDVSAVSPGATHYFNGLRAGSEHTIHRVTDRTSGRELEWEVVKGSDAAKLGVTNLQAEGEYLQVELPRPVADPGEARLLIDKTYRDPDSYRREGADRIVFSRSLGIKRNAVVLPAGYELVACNYPSQVALEEDGRIRVSFMNRGPAGVPYRVEARVLKQPIRPPKAPHPELPSPTRQESVTTSARVNYSFSERAFQDREIVYFLNPPETHSFRLYHDYTESRPGIDRYLNIVRAGSKASNPSAILLDTGQHLKVETLRGKEVRERGIEIQDWAEDTEVVAIWFDPVKPGESRRLRIEETYTDPNRYLLAGEELIWDRGFGRPRNAVLLPPGWVLTSSSIPGTVSEEDGRIRLDFINDRPDNIQVHLKAQRKP